MHIKHLILIEFVSMMQVEELSIGKMKRWILSRNIGEYPDLLLLWNSQKLSKEFYSFQMILYSLY